MPGSVFTAGALVGKRGDRRAPARLTQRTAAIVNSASVVSKLANRVPGIQGNSATVICSRRASQFRPAVRISTSSAAPHDRAFQCCCCAKTRTMTARRNRCPEKQDYGSAGLSSSRKNTSVMFPIRGVARMCNSTMCGMIERVEIPKFAESSPKGVDNQPDFSLRI